MNADLKSKAEGTLKTVWGFTRRFTANSLRRAMIAGRYSLIYWQQQKLRRVQGRLGQEILKATEQGEANPMLAAGGQNALEKAKVVEGGKEKHYQAIEGIREKIRKSRASEAPAGAGEPPPPEAPPQEPPSQEPPSQEAPPQEATPPEAGASGPH